MLSDKQTGRKKPMSDDDSMRYLNLLAAQYPNTNKVCTEIINLQAILNLPKGTEHFISDVHGAYEAFNHVLRNASGVIKDYINEIFSTSLSETEKRQLATLIYYPELKLEALRRDGEESDNWYEIILFRLVQVCKRASSKYTRSKVRKALPAEFAYIIEELLHEENERAGKQEYYNEIIHTIVRLGQAGSFIAAISNVIQRLSIDHLHIIGDIYDRGAGASKIMDILTNYHSVDVQWGNHDISWIGAASGSIACICNVIRVSAKYDNLATVEESYGINLVPLATYAMEHYKDDPCERFFPEREKSKAADKEFALSAKMHKAVTILQLKAEAEVIQRNPAFHMDDMLLLDKINHDGTVNIGGGKYRLADNNMPTVDPYNPFALTREEKNLLAKIKFSFLNSQKLQEHAHFLLNKGSMYSIYNGNLLFHGCVPLNQDGTLKNVNIRGKEFSGRALLTELDKIVRAGFFGRENTDEKIFGNDMMWYLWCGPDSPLYGKDKMTTFERYFTDEKKLYAEGEDPYYKLRDDPSMCERVLRDFGLSEKAHIINGHVPVRVVKGESPVKANGRMLVIDGGFARAYQKVTGIAGYTLISNSHGLMFAAHEPFYSVEEAVENEKDIVSNTEYFERYTARRQVGSTDIGAQLKIRLKELETLALAYQKGLIKES